MCTENTVHELNAAFQVKDSEKFHDIMRNTLDPTYAKRYPASGNGVTFNWKAVVHGEHAVIPFHLLELVIRMDQFDLLQLFYENYAAYRFLEQSQLHSLFQTALDLCRDPRYVKILQMHLWKTHAKQYVMTVITRTGSDSASDLEVLKILLDNDCYWDADCEAKARELGRQDLLDFIAKRTEERKGAYCGLVGVCGILGVLPDPFVPV